MGDNTGWPTTAELDYIDGLATGKWFEGRIDKPDPIRMLRNYLRSAKLRKKNRTFGTVETAIVLAHAEDVLQALERREEAYAECSGIACQAVELF